MFVQAWLRTPVKPDWKQSVLSLKERHAVGHLPKSNMVVEHDASVGSCCKSHALTIKHIVTIKNMSVYIDFENL